MLANLNPFLTSEVYQATHESVRHYMMSLSEQIDANQPIDWLERMLSVSESTLDKFWNEALASATAGNVQGGLLLLAGFLTEWAKFRSLRDLIDAEQSGIPLDLWDSSTSERVRKAFQQSSLSQAEYLATQLHNAFMAGEHQRNQESRESLMQGYSELHSIAMQVIKRQDTTVQEAHTTNQQYADVVHKGFEREQQGIAWMREGVQHMYQFAQVHEQTMVDGMKALTSHMEQRLPSAIEAAQKKRGSRMLWVLLVILLILGGLVVTGILLSQSIVPA